MLWFMMIRQKSWQHLQRKTAQLSSALPSTLSYLLCCGMANFMCPAPFVFGLEKSVSGSLKNPWRDKVNGAGELLGALKLFRYQWDFRRATWTRRSFLHPLLALVLQSVLPFSWRKNGSVASAVWPGLCSYFFKCPYKKEITDLDLCFIISRRSLLH